MPIARRSARPAVEALDARLLMTGTIPRPDHVVVVVEENHSYGEIIGSSAAPYINSLAAGAAVFGESHGVTHPSQPNYLELFSGAAQGVTTDTVPSSPFTTANLGAQLIAAGDTFGGYSQGLPSVGSLVATSGDYARKHNPWSDWQGASANAIPSSANMPFTSFPTSTNYASLPTVSFVVPDLTHDMHNGTGTAPITAADTWLHTNLDAYAQWAHSHNSLLIVTFDEDDGSISNQIPTLFYGAGIAAGTYSENISHDNVLRTIEDMYGLPYAGNASTAAPIDDVWDTPVTAAALIDDGDAGYVDNAWTVGGLSGAYGGDYRATPAGTGTKVATWTFTGVPAGMYDVDGTWMANVNRASNATYTVTVHDDVTGDGGSGDVAVNQRLSPTGAIIGGVSFARIQTVGFTHTGTITVKLTDAANGYVVADAFALVARPAPPAFHAVAPMGATPTAATGLIPMDGATVALPWIVDAPSVKDRAGKVRVAR